jgi:leucyl aminopeptidase (aminopeptidase T)
VSGINKDQRHNTSKIPHKKKLTKKKLNKSKQEHTIVINYNNERLPLMIVNKKEKERICKQIERKCEQDEKVKAEYIDLSEQEEVVKKVKEEITGDKNASASKHSRDQNTKVSNKNNKNEEIMKQIKNSLDDNLKVMFNFSYENFLSKESETESKKSSEQEILITESYET